MISPPRKLHRHGWSASSVAPTIRDPKGRASGVARDRRQLHPLNLKETDSQADSACSVYITRSNQKPQVNGLRPKRSGRSAAPPACKRDPSVARLDELHRSSAVPEVRIEGCRQHVLAEVPERREELDHGTGLVH